MLPMQSPKQNLQKLTQKDKKINKFNKKKTMLWINLGLFFLLLHVTRGWSLELSTMFNEQKGLHASEKGQQVIDKRFNRISQWPESNIKHKDYMELKSQLTELQNHTKKHYAQIRNIMILGCAILFVMTLILIVIVIWEHKKSLVRERNQLRQFKAILYNYSKKSRFRQLNKRVI
ncbi:hypothetical protein GMMP1_680006 [Candidatus Magnetomoraceae bacterium gMMP-1]